MKLNMYLRTKEQKEAQKIKTNLTYNSNDSNIFVFIFIAFLKGIF